MNRLTIALCLGLMLCTSAWADFDAGMRAYRMQNFEQAAEEFRQAAIAGHDTAQFNLGVMYYRGEGVSKDLIEAFSWIELSTQHGDTDSIRAQEILILLLSPDQIRQGHARASELASSHGLAYSPPDLGEMDSRLAVMDQRR